MAKKNSGEQRDTIVASEDIVERDEGQTKVDTSEESSSLTPEVKIDADDQPRGLKSCWQWLLSHKKASIPLLVVVVLAALGAVPFTRYALAGMFIQQSILVRVVDAGTNKPVSSATVRLSGKQAVTDNKGQATIRTNVGNAKLEISKKYYQTASREVLVPFKRSTKLTEVKLKATGRAVPVKVLNAISKKAASNITIKTEGTEAKTDRSGEAIIVVPADKKTLKATLSGEGFNGTEITLQVTSEEVPANTFSATPSGKVYFLSNQSGEIDVVKTNLDGTDRKVVLAGTGKEDKDNTTMSVSSDQKYIALSSRRDGGKDNKLFLIETANDQLTTIDEGNADFQAYGWIDQYYVYLVNRHDKKVWESKLQAFKSYDAKNKKIILLDEVGGEGSSQSNYFYDSIGEAAVVGKEIVYSRGIYAYPGNKAQDKEASLRVVKADGTGKRKLNTSTDTNAFMSYSNSISITYGLRIYEPGELYFVNYRDANKLYEYTGGEAREISGKKASDLYEGETKAYLLSPNGKKSIWTERRDSENVFLVGDGKGENEKQIAAFDEHVLYGWYSDDYVLLSKKGSELYIIPSDGLPGTQEPLKVSDYKPSYYSFY